MNEIAKVKKEVKLAQWTEMVKSRNESGLTVTDWCKCKKSSKPYNNSPESVQKKFATKCTSQRVIDFL